MSGFADYEQYDALGLADLVRRGKVTPRELLDAAIERVEARNPTVNAVVLKLYDLARQTIAALGRRDRDQSPVGWRPGGPVRETAW